MVAFQEDRSLITLREKLTEIGAGVVGRPRYVTFQLAALAIPRRLFAKILTPIDRLRRGPAPTRHPVPSLRSGRPGARREALACYAAAGIDCATREEVRARQADTYRLVTIEGYPRAGGSSWQSMSRGAGDIETEFLNGEICLLGRLHGVPTPVNDACVRMGRALVARGAGPGQFTVAQLRALGAR